MNKDDFFEHQLGNDAEGEAEYMISKDHKEKDTKRNITQVENYVLYHLHKAKKEYFETIRDKSPRIIRHRKDGAMFSLILMANFLGLNPDTISPNSVKELD